MLELFLKIFGNVNPVDAVDAVKIVHGIEICSNVFLDKCLTEISKDDSLVLNFREEVRHTL